MTTSTRTILTLLPIMVGVLAVIGCDGEADDQDYDSALSYFSLSPGSQWIYHCVAPPISAYERNNFVHDVAGTIVDGSGSRWIYVRYRCPIPREVNAAPSIGSSHAYTNRDGQLLSVDLLRWLGEELSREIHQKKPGFAITVHTVPDLDMIRIILPSTIKQGVKWKWYPAYIDTKALGFMANTAEIIATDQTVILLAGLFEDVIIVRYGDIDFFQEYYYAKKIGTIKRMEYATTTEGPITFIYELASYELGSE